MDIFINAWRDRACDKLIADNPNWDIKYVRRISPTVHHQADLIEYTGNNAKYDHCALIIVNYDQKMWVDIEDDKPIEPWNKQEPNKYDDDSSVRLEMRPSATCEKATLCPWDLGLFESYSYFITILFILYYYIIYTLFLYYLYRRRYMWFKSSRARTKTSYIKC